MEKSCKYKRSDAWLYVQNRMSREEEAEFQLHLLHCDGCREELARYRQMVRSMGEKERRVLSFRGWIMAASITCLIVGGGSYWYHRTAGNGGAELTPGGVHDVNVKPPVLRNGTDSVAPQDSIAGDTVRIFVEE